MDEVIEEASKKYQGLVPLVYDVETMGLAEARPQDMPYAVFLKREADKVIARQKYMRCLAMANWCDDAARLATWDTDYRRCGWYNKWRKRWLAIAEKFKPNSTAQ